MSFSILEGIDPTSEAGIGYYFTSLNKDDL